MLYLTCTMISSVDLAYYGVSSAKDWVSVDCGSISCYLSVQVDKQWNNILYHHYCMLQEGVGGIYFQMKQSY